MPSTVKVRIYAARNLPAVDSRLAATQLSLSSPSLPDVYVAVTLGGHSGLVADYDDSSNHGETARAGSYKSLNYNASTFSVSWSGLGGGGGGTDPKRKMYSAKTKVHRRSLDPTWNEEFRFEVADDTLLQDEPLIFKVWHSDAIGSDESIGLVYVDLNPLLTRTATEDYEGRNSTDESSAGDRSSRNAGKGRLSSGVIDGWFPVYDTLGGVRGELKVSVKLNFIGDVNPFRDSSAGVQLFPFSELDLASGYAIA